MTSWKWTLTGAAALPTVASMNVTTLRGSLLAALACLLVGGSFTANSVLGAYPYAGGQALRYGLACLLLAPVVGAGAGARLRALTPRLWLRLALLAAVGTVGFNMAVLAAERSAEPAVPGVLVGCAPVVVGVLVPLLEGRRPRRSVLAGASLVAVGAFTVQGWGRTDGAGLACSVCALAGEVGFAVLAVPVLRLLGPRLLSAAVCGIAAAEAAVTGLLLDGGAWLRRPDGAEAAALLCQAAVVTVVGFVCWYMGVQRIGAERATIFSGLIPVAAACTAPSSERAPTAPPRPSEALSSGVGSPWGRCGEACPPGLSGCRREAPARRAPGRRSSGSDRSRAVAPGARRG